MQRNTLIQTFGHTVWVSFTGLLTLAVLWLGLFWTSPAAIADVIESEASVVEHTSDSQSNPIGVTELETEISNEPPAEASVNLLGDLAPQEPMKGTLDLQAVDAIKSQTEKALQLVEVNAKQVFGQAKVVAEKASSKAEDAFDELLVWLKSFSS